MATRMLICPRCKSTNIAPHPKDGHKVKHGQIFEATYTKHVCEKCGYSGTFFPEAVAERSSARPRKSKAFSRVSKHRLAKSKKSRGK